MAKGKSGLSSSGGGAFGSKSSISSEISALPALTGSEKQVSWANDIRKSTFESFNELASEKGMEYVAGRLHSGVKPWDTKSGGYYIDEFYDTRKSVKDVQKEYTKAFNETKQEYIDRYKTSKMQSASAVISARGTLNKSSIASDIADKLYKMDDWW